MSQPSNRHEPRRERQVAVRRLRLLVILLLVCMTVVVAVGRPNVWVLFLLPLVLGTVSFFESGAVLVSGAAGVSWLVRSLVEGGATTATVLDGLLAAGLFAAGGLALARAFHRRAEAERRLAADSLSDRLTGLYNYGTFTDLLARELSRADRYGGRVALIMLDLDHFKRFNDRHGHQAGNRALREVGRLLQGLVRDADIAARYGGEEFAIVIRGDELDGIRLAERVRQAVLSLRVPVSDGEASISVSVGVACYPEAAAHGAQLVENADAALYVSKQAGRNLVTGFSLGVEGRRRPAVGEPRLRAVAG